MRLFQIVLCAALLQILGIRPAFADPAAPSYFGGIDLGSRGVKAFLYRFVKTSEGIVPSSVFKDEINTKLVSSAQNNRFTTAGIEEATKAVTTLLGEMKKKAGELNLDTPNYYVVGSSGVRAFDNHDDLKKAVDSAANLSLEFVDAAEEANDGYLSAVPKIREPNALFVDIGSGNTKLTCKIKDLYNPVEIRSGTVSTRTKAVSAGGDYAEALKGLIDGDISQSYDKERMNTPCLESRNRIYMIGGAVWAAATLTHPEGAYWGFLELTRRDLDSLLHRLQDGTYQNDPVFRFSPAATPAQQALIRDEAAKQRKKVFDTFSKEDLMAGVSLVRLVVSKGNPNARAFFVRNGNYLYGYAIKKYEDMRLDNHADPLIAGK